MKNGLYNGIGGRVVKWKGRVASIAPALASVSVVALMATGAFGQTVFDSLENSEQTIIIDEDITVTADGKVRLQGGNDLAPIYIDVPDYSSVVTNDGSVDVLQNSGTQPGGIWLTGDLSGGSIINNGEITVDVMNSDSSASASGIYVSGEVNGSITNSSTGLIDVLVASDSYEVTAYGIYVYGNVGEVGVITNAGMINVEADSTEESVSAYGVYVDGYLDGAIDNSGTIDVRAESDSSTASAYGIYVSGDVGGTGSIENSGELLVEALAGTEHSATAYGIYAEGDLYGSIVNTGTGLIDVSAHSGTSDASAYGIYVYGSVEDGATIANDGMIAVEAYTPESSSAYAYGIYVSSDMDGTIDNTGTIDVYAEAGSSSVSAYGIYVDGTVGGDITNAGDIIVEGFNGTDTDASATGIYASTLDGSITNSGLIDVFAQSVTSDASGYGIYVDNDMNGTITNTQSGVITVAASAPGGEASAIGVYVNANVNVDGGIVNDGTIEAFAEVLDSATASAYGIYVESDLDGTIVNTGDILASASATGYYAYAYGIEIDGNLDGTITNTGTITAKANAQYIASAYGMYIDGALNGTIDGNGTISATAISDTYSASAYGIYVADGIGANGLIDVSGLIEATAEADTYSASASGIYVDGDMDGTITVSGTIAADAQTYDNDYYATAAGIYISGNVSYVSDSGTTTGTGTGTGTGSTGGSRFASVSGGANTGSIVVTSTGVIDVYAENNSSSDAYAAGIYLDGNLGGTIENHGLITVEADSSSSYAEAVGIRVDEGTVYGSITNTGTIEAHSASFSSSAQAYGIWADAVGVDGTVTNAGYIDVYTSDNGTSSNSDYAAGVYLPNMNGHFINTGSIIARDKDSVGTAIYVNGIEGRVTLNTGGFIVGGIDLNGSGNLNIQGDVGRSVKWTADVSGASGNVYTNDEGYLGTTVFVAPLSQEARGLGEGQVATLDSSGLAAVRQAGADAGFIGLDALLSQTGKAAAKPVAEGDGGGNALVPFVAVASKSATYGDSETMLDQDVTTSAISFGGTMAMDSGLTFGLGAGTMNGSATVDYIDGPASETDQKGAFIGLAMGGTSGNLNFAGAISGGRMQFDNARYVNDNTALDGIVTEEAAFDSSFMAVEFAVSGRFDIGSDMALVPNTSLRYAKHKVDGYAEVGSDGAADVGPQDFGVFEGEIGVAVEKAMGNGVFSGGISVMSRSITGDEDVQVSMIGDTNFVDAAIGSSSAAKLSVGYSSSFSTSGEFNVDVETMVGSNGMSGGKISGAVRFSF